MSARSGERPRDAEDAIAIDDALAIAVAGLAAPDARGEESAWFDRLRSGRLSFLRCGVCASAVFPPRPRCPECGGSALDWEDASGRGVVYSFTVQRRRTRPDMPEPSVMALVDLVEGPRLLTRVETEPATVRIGMDVMVRFATVDGTVVPVFVPASG